MRTVILGLFALTALHFAATPAAAFNGKRRGFVLGGGLGAAVTSYTQTVSLAKPQFFVGDTKVGETKDDAFGVAGELRIGFGISDTFMGFVSSSAVGASTITHGLGAIGFSLYFRGESPSPYLLAFGGVAQMFGDEDSSLHFGSGFGGGFGWEFSPHYSLEAAVSWRRAQREEGFEFILGPYLPGIETETFSLLLTAVGLAY